jgi:hypothetical protein
VAEQWAGEHVVGRTEVWVVEDVEELGPETEAQALGQVELTLERDVSLGGTKGAEDDASKIALLPNRGVAKAALLYAGQVQQLGGANPLPNLMEVKG